MKTIRVIMVELKIALCLFFFVLDLTFSEEVISSVSANDSTVVGQLLFTGDEKRFEIDTEEGKMKLQVKFNGKVTVHEIISSYTFLTPKVDILCDCNCRNPTGIKCSDDTLLKFKECVALHNSTTTCTIYYDNDINTSVCPKWYRICCEIFFTKSFEDGGKFRAIKLQHQKSYYNVTVSMESSCDHVKTFSLAIPEGVQTLHLPSHVVIEINHTDSQLPLVTDGWYFMQQNSTNLLAYSKMNEVGEQDISKIGWLQVSNDTMPSVVFSTVRRRLKIIPLNCATTFQFDWEMNSTQHYRNGLLLLPKDVQPIYENISNFVVDDEASTVVIGEKVSPGIEVTVLDVNTFTEESNFNFHPHILRSQDSELKLRLTFLSGNGSFLVDVFDHKHIINQSFEVEINMTTPKTSVDYEHPLSSEFTEVSWVCVYQGSIQLCQFITISEMSENVTTESSNLHIPPNLLEVGTRNLALCDDVKQEKYAGSIYVLYLPLFLIFATSTVSLMVYYKRNYFLYVGHKCKSIFWNKFTQVDNENLI